MKIKLTGTGSITSMQNCASCLINEEILIDCGNGIIKSLMKNSIDIYKINIVLITHLHADHFFDLPFIILLRSFRRVKEQLVIYGPKGLRKAIALLFEVGYADIEDWEEHLNNGNTLIMEYTELDVAVNKYRIKSYEVNHGNFKPAYGFTVSDEQSILGYSGDSGICLGVEEIVKKSDLAIMDCSFPQGVEAHMGVNDLERLLNQYDDKEIVATHMSSESRKLALSSNNERLIVLEDMFEIEI
ncbi:MAG: ribonuclease Z [Erysipelotrichia bacterium]|nr:ribonuclease Z [Erysipelotrichia bacterium]